MVAFRGFNSSVNNSALPSTLYSQTLSYANGIPEATARIRTTDADFQVVEDLGYEPAGEGEHYYLWVEKEGQNTEFVAEDLARRIKVHRKFVSYAGMKDRHAITRQWFSVHLPGKDELAESLFDGSLYRVLTCSRHLKKLHTGVLQGNHFKLVLREFQGDRCEFEARLQRVKENGFPNYFGEQRFGYEGGNLEAAEAMLLAGKRVRSRHKRGLYLSAARSWLFNWVLHHRVELGCWRDALLGDLLNIDGSGSIFPYLSVAEVEDVSSRTRQGLIHPTAPMWGAPCYFPLAKAGRLEAECLEPFESLLRALESSGLNASRRSLRAMPRDLQWRWLEEGVETDAVELCFYLPKGCYATSLMRELFLLS